MAINYKDKGRREAVKLAAAGGVGQQADMEGGRDGERGGREGQEEGGRGREKPEDGGWRLV